MAKLQCPTSKWLKSFARSDNCVAIFYPFQRSPESEVRVMLKWWHLYCIFTQINIFVVTIIKRRPMVLLVGEVPDNLDVVGEPETTSGLVTIDLNLNDITWAPHRWWRPFWDCPASFFLIPLLLLSLIPLPLSPLSQLSWLSLPPRSPQWYPPAEQTQVLQFCGHSWSRISHSPGSPKQRERAINDIDGIPINVE